MVHLETSNRAASMTKVDQLKLIRTCSPDDPPSYPLHAENSLTRSLEKIQPQESTKLRRVRFVIFDLFEWVGALHSGEEV